MSIFAPAKRINYISTNLKIMYLDAAKKQEIFEKYGKSNTDTERALTTLVGKRRALLNYLKDRDIERYRAIVKALGLRK